MCIDICPVGALTSGAYRYKTRPWEMKHVGTTCTHCADGCKTTLGVRRSDTGMEIVRGDNRDKSGINGDFLCIKGRYAFDFAQNEDRTDAAPGTRSTAASFPRPGKKLLSWSGRSSQRFAIEMVAKHSASSALTARPTKRIICCRSSRAWCWAPTISTITERRTSLGRYSQHVRVSKSGTWGTPRSYRFHARCVLRVRDPADWERSD